jgi:hypothetical protein
VLYVSLQMHVRRLTEFARAHEIVEIVALFMHHRERVEERRCVAEVPLVEVLADQRCRIAVVVEVPLDGRRCVESGGAQHAVLRMGRVAPDPGVVRIAARHDRRPGGTAEWVRDITELQTDALTSEQSCRLRHGTQAVTLIVGDDDEDVRSRVAVRAGGSSPMSARPNEAIAKALTGHMRTAIRVCQLERFRMCGRVSAP